MISTLQKISDRCPEIAATITLTRQAPRSAAHASNAGADQ